MPINLRRSVAALAVVSAAAALGAGTTPAAAAVAPPISSVDIAVARSGSTPVVFHTLPDARCELAAPGNHSRFIVYSDDHGAVVLHFTPARNGALNGTLGATCTARGVSATHAVRLHVVTGSVRSSAARLAPGATPLLPRGVDPARVSDADVRRLQLPPRPDPIRNAADFALWKRAMTSPVVRVGGTTVLRTDVVHGPSRIMHRQRPAQGRKNGYATSDNWSGVVDTGSPGQFTYWVAGQWNVPAVSTDIFDSPAYSSTWDGIDGDGSGDVIQNGTEQDAYNFPFFGSFAFYSAWYEFFPDNGSTTLPNFSVNPGDQIYAVSWVCYDGSGNRYGCYYMQNLTQGEASPVYSELGAQPALFSGNSAEWIVERPTVNGGLNPLPQFAAFPFWWQHVYDSFAGVGYQSCVDPYDILTMTNNNDYLATSSAPNCDVSTFSWLNYQ